MNKSIITHNLQEKYPDKTIIYLPEESPKEILCEVDPTSDHPEYSVAIAVIDKSKPHVHYKTTETYKVLKGNLKLYKDGVEHSLLEGDVYTILPGEVHHAIGNATWIEVTSHPGWTIADHVLK